MLEIVFWDVNHGSAAYIKTPNNRHIAVDLGTGSYTNDKPFSPLLYLKKQYGVDSFDMIFMTHPHRDHLDDIFNFTMVNPKTIWRPNHLSDDDIRKANRSEDKAVIDKYLEVTRTFTSNPDQANDARVPQSWGGVQFQIFPTNGCASSNLNNQSGVLLATYGDFKVLFTGDNESCSWKLLLADKTFCTAVAKTHVLLAPHHGRESGYCSDLFDVFKPALTVVSDGRFCETSATSRYSAVSKGWVATYPDGTKENRYCVTTRNDGVITLKLWRENNQNYYHVGVTKGSAKTQAVKRVG